MSASGSRSGGREGAEVGPNAGPGARSPRRPTLRQRRGARGEDLAVEYLEGLGWRILARRERVNRAEVDIIAIEPAGHDRSATLVAVEVRSRVSLRFGTPEESVDHSKVMRLYRAVAALRASGSLADGSLLPRMPWRVDLIAVDQEPCLQPGLGGPSIRHLRALEPP